MTYEIPGQQGRLAVVTGANSGTGKQAALALAGAGAQVVMAVRTLARGEEVKAEILAQHPSAIVEVRRLDLADLSSVEEFADRLIADHRAVDLLLNNAGVMMLPERHETADGFEMQLGTNFFGHFALTVRLLPALLKATAPRVVTMTSSNQGPIDFDDLQGERSYSRREPTRARSWPTCCSASSSPASRRSADGTCSRSQRTRATPPPASSTTAPSSAAGSPPSCGSPGGSPRATPPRPGLHRSCTPRRARRSPRAAAMGPDSAWSEAPLRRG